MQQFLKTFCEDRRLRAILFQEMQEAKEDRKRQRAAIAKAGTVESSDQRVSPANVSPTTVEDQVRDVCGEVVASVRVCATPGCWYSDGRNGYLWAGDSVEVFSPESFHPQGPRTIAMVQNQINASTPQWSTTNGRGKGKRSPETK